MKINFFNKPKKKEEAKPLDQAKFWNKNKIEGFEKLKDEILGEDRLKQTGGNFLKSEQKDNKN